MADEEAAPPPLPIVLFGYDSSPFTQKIRLALKLRQIPYTFVLVPSMMPRPVLLSNFNLTYRKIPVMAIGKELYIDTSLILEAIALHPSYPPSRSHPALHPSPQHRTLTRLLSSHYTDRPLFRLTTGTIPQTVWETHFGTDRSNLIGHTLNAAKLGKKVSRNIASLDTYLSILEPLFVSRNSSSKTSDGWNWFLNTPSPTAADISLFYQLDWSRSISKGIGVNDLTGGQATDSSNPGIDPVFNGNRYPNLHSWFLRVKSYFDALPSVEARIERNDEKGIAHIISTLNAADQPGPVPLLRTAAPQNGELDSKNGLKVGARVSVAPDDTGRADPTVGTLVGLSTEEVVIVPDLVGGKKGRVEGIRVHFPRVGFVVLPLGAEEVIANVPVRVGRAKL